MDTWRLLVNQPANGPWNMAVDEALLESCGSGESLPTLRLFAWKPPCLSLGYAQPIQDVDLDGLHTQKWDLVRRPTGGRAILHTDELTYSIMGPLAEPRLAGTVLESYNRLAGALLETLHVLGLPAEKNEKAVTPAMRNSNPVCFEVPSTYEITVGGKKLIGSAQARRKDGVLQHGSLPLSGDLTRILKALAFPNETLRKNAAERLLLRATTVEQVLGRVVGWGEASKAFIQAFEDHLQIIFIRGELTEKETSRAHDLVREKYGNPAWNQRNIQED